MATTAQQITQLENRRQAILDLIEDINTDGRDLPNANDPENVNHIEKIRAWYEELDLIDKRIASLEDPWEVTSEMYG
jgi:hypothetical protein